VSTYSSSDKSVAVKLFVSIYLISLFFFKPDMQFARFVFLTKAIAHHQTTAIDQVEQDSGLSVVDKFSRDGRGYISPTPGLSVLALISYLPYSQIVLSGSDYITKLAPEAEFKLSQFIMTLSTVTFFTALTVSLFYLWLRRLDVQWKRALFFSLLLYGGTPLVFYSLNITNGQNVLEMGLLFLAFFLLQQADPPSGANVWLSGMCVGLSIFCNITAGFLLGLFLFYLFDYKSIGVRLLWLSGLTVGGLSLIVYNLMSFGNLLPSYNNLLFEAGVTRPHFSDIWVVFWVFVSSPRIGLIFFSPVVLMGLHSAAHQPRTKISTIRIQLAVFTYLILVSYATAVLNIRHGFGDGWYAVMGGGGPRYLLPVLPYLVGLVAVRDFKTGWQTTLTVALCSISLLINLPGLFWTGGQAWFLNNLLLFLKNGVHSYMLEEFRALFLYMSLNVSRMSIYPSAALLAVFLWWLWKGNVLVGDLFSRVGSSRHAQETPDV